MPRAVAKVRHGTIDEGVLSRFSVVDLDFEQAFGCQTDLCMVLFDANGSKDNFRGWVAGFSAKVDLTLCKRIVNQARHLLILT